VFFVETVQMIFTWHISTSRL